MGFPGGRATARSWSVLQQLHEGHPEFTRIKLLARMYVWWPGIGQEIEKCVHTCHECQVNQSSPPVMPIQPWKWPTRPWAGLPLDYADPFLDIMFLILIDVHSKWIEACCMTSATSATTIECLHQIFAHFGVPETVVTDMGLVYLRNFGRGESCLPGWIVNRTSSVALLIHGLDGQTFRQHQDHLRPRQGDGASGTNQSVAELPVDDSTVEAMPTQSSSSEESSSLVSDSVHDTSAQASHPGVSSGNSVQA